MQFMRENTDCHADSGLCGILGQKNFEVSYIKCSMLERGNDTISSSIGTNFYNISILGLIYTGSYIYL